MVDTWGTPFCVLLITTPDGCSITTPPPGSVTGGPPREIVWLPIITCEESPGTAEITADPGRVVGTPPI
jgi:hypothetical protein